MSTFTDSTAAYVRLLQVATERWPVHLATGQGWCGPGRLVLGPEGGDLFLQLENWETGLAVGQRVLMVARSWDTAVECFTTVSGATTDGEVILDWPESLDATWTIATRRPESVPGGDKQAA